jgi:hypothetical protein
MPGESRIESGRNRAASAKRALSLLAAGGFLVVFGLARLAHPGTAATRSSQLSPPASISSEVRQGLQLGGGSISSPSNGSSPGTSSPTPQAQTGTS